MAAGERGPVCAVLSPDVEWTEAEGSPYAGTYRGPGAVERDVLARWSADWDACRADLTELHDAGAVIVATGHYSGTYRRTLRPMRAAFAHLWTVREGQVIRFVQYVDTIKLWEAISE